ncbi:hypothetical protein EV401DRAFT_1938928 [Pisolithus croceorrhizus]|nr:hypothetical protein EV401DRAFT_1938928 [Pisolithus croceorrhizus]
MAPFLPPMIAVTPDETTPPLSHIVSTVVKFFTEYFILVSDWITDHLPEAQEWVTSHPFHVAAAIVGVVLLIFVFVPWILSWVALAVNAVWSGLKSIFQLVWRSLQWFGRAFVHCLGFRTKGVTKGSISRVWLLHAGPFLLAPPFIIPVCGRDAALEAAQASRVRCSAGIDISSAFVGMRSVDISQTLMAIFFRGLEGAM